jgi:hypothetical protein
MTTVLCFGGLWFLSFCAFCIFAQRHFYCVKLKLSNEEKACPPRSETDGHRGETHHCRLWRKPPLGPPQQGRARQLLIQAHRSAFSVGLKVEITEVFQVWPLAPV